jgi:hypothetical protein
MHWSIVVLNTGQLLFGADPKSFLIVGNTLLLNISAVIGRTSCESDDLPLIYVLRLIVRKPGLVQQCNVSYNQLCKLMV